MMAWGDILRAGLENVEQLMADVMSRIHVDAGPVRHPEQSATGAQTAPMFLSLLAHLAREAERLRRLIDRVG